MPEDAAKIRVVWRPGAGIRMRTPDAEFRVRLRRSASRHAAHHRQEQTVMENRLYTRNATRIVVASISAKLYLSYNTTAQSVLTASAISRLMVSILTSRCG